MVFINCNDYMLVNLPMWEICGIQLCVVMLSDAISVTGAPKLLINR